MAGSSANDAALREHFEVFCNFGNHHGDRKITINDKNVVKCLKDCKILGRCVTTTDSDIAFSKVKEKGKKEINFTQFKDLLTELAPKFQKQKGLGSPEVALQDMLELIVANSPSLDGTTKQSKTGGVERMTDTQLYTGSHKERFDEEGKGKGLEGRMNIVENEGYVGQYKGKDTYDKSHSPKF